MLPHKEAIEQHLLNRLGELFELDYDLLLYDVTSTNFEGLADPAIAKRGCNALALHYRNGCGRLRWPKCSADFEP